MGGGEKRKWRETGPLKQETLWEAGWRNVYVGLQGAEWWSGAKEDEWVGGVAIVTQRATDINWNILAPCLW